MEFNRRKIIIELKDSVDLMNSEDYIERSKAEYSQTKVRHDKLDVMTIKMSAGTPDFTPACSMNYLLEQKCHMGMYLR